VRDGGQQFVAAHANQPSDLIDFGDHSVFTQRLYPRLSVRAVAINQRSIDIEQQGFEGHAESQRDLLL
jgi:hypothetical protein